MHSSTNGKYASPDRPIVGTPADGAGCNLANINKIGNRLALISPVVDFATAECSCSCKKSYRAGHLEKNSRLVSELWDMGVLAKSETRLGTPNRRFTSALNNIVEQLRIAQLFENTPLDLLLHRRVQKRKRTVMRMPLG